VVDDEVDFLSLTEKILRKTGARVMLARSATEGLWLAMRAPPDLVFLDLFLPGSDGFELLTILRTEPETRHAPVFSVSAAYIEDRHDLLRAGFAGHFAKPVAWAHLCKLIATIR